MTSWLRAFFVIAALTVPVGGAQAAGAVDNLGRLGPAVGSQVPQTIKVPDQNNQYQTFKSLARKRGLIVLFSRSLDW